MIYSTLAEPAYKDALYDFVLKVEEGGTAELTPYLDGGATVLRALKDGPLADKTIHLLRRDPETGRPVATVLKDDEIDDADGTITETPE